MRRTAGGPVRRGKTFSLDRNSFNISRWEEPEGNAPRSALGENERERGFLRLYAAFRPFGWIWRTAFGSGFLAFSFHSQRSSIGHSQHFGLRAVQQYRPWRRSQ